MKEIEDRSALPFDRLTALRDIEGLAAGGAHSPDALTPGPCGRPPRALGDAPVDHHEPESLLGDVLTERVAKGWLDVETAVDLIRGAFWDNPLRIYGVG